MSYRANVAAVIVLLFATSLSTVSSAAEGLVVIDGDAVSYDEFERMAVAEIRQTFYHSKPDDEAAHIEFRRAVADRLVDRKLKLREAHRRGLVPDSEYVALELAKYEAQYGDTERWEVEGEAMLGRLRSYFEEDSLLQQIDAALRQAPDPSEEKIRAYYERNIEKFTEPEQVHLSVILIGVPAWAESAAWDRARVQAAEIATRIRDGKKFADAAREHSTDPTAANGGDMGFVHAGILTGELRQVVSDLEPGEIAAAPVTVLEGVVLVRLEGRREPQLHSLDEVLERATGLWRRDTAEAAYETAVARLRESSEIVFDEQYLERLPN